MNKNTTSIVLATAFLAGCAQFQAYESVTSGPKAKLNFSSPSLEGFILADTDLDLQIYEANKDCDLTIKGRIELEPDEKEKSVFIPAEKYIFLNVKYFQNCFGCGATSGGKSFAFLPEDGKEYTVVYEDKAINFGLSLFEGAPEKKVADVESVRWSKCSSLDKDKI